jgi:hypothetical protein
MNLGNEQDAQEIQTAETLMMLLQQGAAGVYDAIWSWLFCAPPPNSNLTVTSLKSLSRLQHSLCASTLKKTPHDNNGFLAKSLYGTNPSLTTTSMPTPFAMSSFHEICQVHLPLMQNLMTPLIKQPAFQKRIKKVPGFFRFSSWGLEIRLNEHDAIDFAFNLGPLFESQTPISEAFTPGDIEEQQRWQKKYQKQKNKPRVLMPGWIEIDAEDITYQGPQENLFFNIHPKAQATDIQIALKHTYPEHDWDTAWPPVATFVTNLPSSANFTQLGVMQRRGYILKAVAFNFAPENLFNFLTTLNWKGNTALLTQVLDTLALYPEFRIALSLDFDAEIQDSLGLEIHYFPDKSKNLFHDPRGFQVLVQKHFAALMRFLNEPLFKDVIDENKRLEMAQYPKVLVGKPFFLYACTINHIKISISDTLKVKAYLYQELRL